MMKKLYSFFALLFIGIALLAQQKESVTITPGELYSTLSSTTAIEEVTELTVNGSMDARDFRTMRDDMPSLVVIDLSNADIVPYQGTEGTYPDYIEYAPNFIPFYAFCDPFSWNGKMIQSIQLPESLIAIGEGAFTYCNNLDKIEINSTIEYIGPYAFAGTSATFEVNTENQYFSSVEGVLYDKEFTTLQQCPISITGNFVLPKTTTKINSYAFENCIDLTSITIQTLEKIDLSEVDNPFAGIDLSLLKLYVPAGHYDYYSNSLRWWNFGEIIEEAKGEPYLILGGKFIINGNTHYSTSLESNTSWTISVDQDWVVVNQISGTGDKDLKFDYKSNNTKEYRNATITISGNGVSPQTITITQEPTPDYVNVSKNAISVGSAASNSEFVTVTTLADGLPWMASSDEDWVVVTSSVQMKSGDLYFNISENTTTSERTANITVISGVSNYLLTKETITITQAAASTFIANLSVSTNSVTLNSASNSASSVAVKSNTSWTANADQTWIMLSKTKGDGDDVISFEVEENTEETAREAIVTVSANGVTPQVIKVIQSGFAPSLEATIDTLIYEYTDAYSIAVYILSNSSWKVSSDQSWLTIDTDSGEGNGKLYFSISENDTYSPRTATLSISATGAETKLITITQLAKEIELGVSVKAMEIMYYQSINYYNFDLTANSTWTAKSDAEWLTVNSSAGEGDKSFYFAVTENNTNSARTATITITSGNKTQQVTVVQKNKLFTPTLDVANNRIVFESYASKNANGTVLSNTAWTVSVDADWVELTTTSGTGESFIYFSVLANPTKDPRTAIITIKAEGVESKQITIYQMEGTGTGINHFDSETIRIYPNPTTDCFKLSGISGTATLRIINTAGQLVQVHEVENNALVDVRSLRKGLYWAVLTNAEGTFKKKFIKE